MRRLIGAICTLLLSACATNLAPLEPRPLPAPVGTAQAHPAAVFTAEYQAAHRARVEVLVPEVYEMMTIALAMTDVAGASDSLVPTGTEYYARVEAHFGPFRHHSLIRALDAAMRQEPIMAYVRAKLNAYAFEFAPNGRIVRSGVYDRIFDDLPENTLLSLLDEMQSFADATDFRAFYTANHDVYDEQIRFLRDRSDTNRMRAWLQERFAGVVTYDGVKVILSPLAGSIQNLVTFEHNGYREMQPHINFPYNGRPELTEAGNAVWRGTQLFGEINHGYINPAAEPYTAQIDAAITDRGLWTTESNAEAYPDDQSLFNEYMNFGVIVLYHRDHMNEDDSAFARRRIENIMVEGRGFKKFAQFDAMLVDLYEHRQSGETIVDLYPRIIAWFRAQSPTVR